MGKISLARVDERLIHGQVMTNLSKRSGANAIFVVDDMTAKDAFMNSIFLSAGSRTGLKVKIFTVEQAISYWKEQQFEQYNCILLTKNIGTMYELARAGVRIEELNLGGIARKPDTVVVLSTVCIKPEEAKQLEEMQRAYGVSEIYFQTVPASRRMELAEALKKF